MKKSRHSRHASYISSKKKTRRNKINNKSAHTLSPRTLSHLATLTGIWYTN